MNRAKLRRLCIWLLVGLVVFFIAYSIFFRTFFNSREYLRIAYDYTGRDPHILNWEEPFFEIIVHQGKLAVHMVFHTDEDSIKGPYSLYIDPFKKEVFAEDPRQP